MKKKKKKKWQRKVCFHFREWLFSWKINYKSVQKCLWKSFKSAMWIIEAQRISKTIPGLLVGHYASTWLLPDTPIRSGYNISSLLASACYTTVRSSIATVTTVRCIVHVRTAGAPQVLIVFQLTFLLLFLADGMQLGNSIKRHSTYSSPIDQQMVNTSANRDDILAQASGKPWRPLLLMPRGVRILGGCVSSHLIFRLNRDSVSSQNR
jgi:hypothetical protein